jgi:hypothetical protein
LTDLALSSRSIGFADVIVSGRRFAWQNKSQLAIRPNGCAAANHAPVLAMLIRPVCWACGVAE